MSALRAFAESVEVGRKSRGRSSFRRPFSAKMNHSVPLKLVLTFFFFSFRNQCLGSTQDQYLFGCGFSHFRQRILHKRSLCQDQRELCISVPFGISFLDLNLACWSYPVVSTALKMTHLLFPGKPFKVS